MEAALDAAGGATLQRKGQQIIKKSNRISARSKSIQSKASKSSKSSKSSRASNLAAKKVCTPLVINITDFYDATTVRISPYLLILYLIIKIR